MENEKVEGWKVFKVLCVGAESQKIVKICLPNDPKIMAITTNNN